MAHETKEQRWRKEGRREAANMLIEKLHPESIDHETMVGSSRDISDEYCAYWNPEEVYKFFDAEQSESYLEQQLKIANKYHSEAMDARLVEGMLKKIIEDFSGHLSSNGNTQLDRAAYYLGLHPDQQPK